MQLEEGLVNGLSRCYRQQDELHHRLKENLVRVTNTERKETEDTTSQTHGGILGLISSRVNVWRPNLWWYYNKDVEPDS